MGFRLQFHCTSNENGKFSNFEALRLLQTSLTTDLIRNDNQFDILKNEETWVKNIMYEAIGSFCFGVGIYYALHGAGEKNLTFNFNPTEHENIDGTFYVHWTHKYSNPAYSCSIPLLLQGYKKQQENPNNVSLIGKFYTKSLLDLSVFGGAIVAGIQESTLQKNERLSVEETRNVSNKVIDELILSCFPHYGHIIA